VIDLRERAGAKLVAELRHTVELVGVVRLGAGAQELRGLVQGPAVECVMFSTETVWRPGSKSNSVEIW